jgi:hypothetical protein
MTIHLHERLLNAWRMRRSYMASSILVGTVILISFISLYIFSTRPSKVIQQESRPLSRPSNSSRIEKAWKLNDKLGHNNEIKHGVVMVTGLTHDRLARFWDVENFYQKVWENREHYAEAHGIPRIFRLMPIGYHNMLVDFSKYTQFEGKNPVWRKLAVIMEAFETYPSAEWVWWLDIDAIIMTPSLDLYTYILNPDILRTHLIHGEIIKNTQWYTDNTVFPWMKHELT